MKKFFNSILILIVRFLLLLFRFALNVLMIIFRIEKEIITPYYECLYKLPSKDGYLFKSEICKLIEKNKIIKKFDESKISGEIDDYKIVFDSNYRKTNDFKPKMYPDSPIFFDEGWVYCIENKLSYNKKEKMPEPITTAEKSDRLSLSLTHTLNRKLNENETVDSLISDDIQYYLHSLKEGNAQASFSVGMNFEINYQNYVIYFDYKNYGKDLTDFIHKIKTETYARLLNVQIGNNTYYWFHTWLQNDEYVRFYIQSYEPWSDSEHKVELDVIVKKEVLLKELEKFVDNLNYRIKKFEFDTKNQN